MKELKMITPFNSLPVVEAEDNSDYRAIALEIRDIINEGGYNAVSQLSGYLLSDDPTHISNYKNARALAGKLDRDLLLEDIVRYYLENIDGEKENAEKDKQ